MCSRLLVSKTQSERLVFSISRIKRRWERYLNKAIVVFRSSRKILLKVMPRAKEDRLDS